MACSDDCILQALPPPNYHHLHFHELHVVTQYKISVLAHNGWFAPISQAIGLCLAVCFGRSSLKHTQTSKQQSRHPETVDGGKTMTKGGHGCSFFGFFSSKIGLNIGPEILKLASFWPSCKPFLCQLSVLSYSLDQKYYTHPIYYYLGITQAQKVQ